MDPETPAFCTAAKQVLDKLGVRRMVMGHTPDFDRIVSRCDGALVVIDTGAKELSLAHRSSPS